MDNLPGRWDNRISTLYLHGQIRDVCSHIRAILFFLESESHAPQSCTQELFKCNKPHVIESISYAKVCDLPFAL